jgi:hypothetical protein
MQDDAILDRSITGSQNADDRFLDEDFPHLVIASIVHAAKTSSKKGST